MYYYKDYNYLNYILDSDFKVSYSLFCDLRNRKLLEIDKEQKDRILKFYLASNQRSKITFEEYYNLTIDNMLSNKKISNDAKISEEKRIIEKFQHLNDSFLNRKGK